jgi:hypothetical protein
MQNRNLLLITLPPALYRIPCFKRSVFVDVRVLSLRRVNLKQTCVTVQTSCNICYNNGQADKHTSSLKPFEPQGHSPL